MENHDLYIVNSLLFYFTDEASNVWCSQLEFISLWLREVLIAICLISSCQFMANLQLMFGIKERKASFVKWWLVVEFIEIFLIFWLFLFELFLFIYESDMENPSMVQHSAGS